MSSWKEKYIPGFFVFSYLRHIWDRRTQASKTDIDSLVKRRLFLLNTLRGLFSEELKKKIDTSIADDFSSLIKDISTSYQDFTADELQIASFANELSEAELKIIIKKIKQENWKKSFEVVIQKHPGFQRLSLVLELLDIQKKIVQLFKNRESIRIKQGFEDRMNEISNRTHSPLDFKYAGNIFSIYPISGNAISHDSIDAVQDDFNETFEDIYSVLKDL